MTAEDRLPVRSENDRALRIIRRIADALDIPVEALLDGVTSGSWPEPQVRVGDGMPERELGAAAGYGSRTFLAPARDSPDRERQAAEMQVLFERVSKRAEREACLSFVRVRAVG